MHALWAKKRVRVVPIDVPWIDRALLRFSFLDAIALSRDDKKANKDMHGDGLTLLLALRNLCSLRLKKEKARSIASDKATSKRGSLLQNVKPLQSL